MEKSGGAICLRVCYQRGLPRLVSLCQPKSEAKNVMVLALCVWKSFGRMFFYCLKPKFCVFFLHNFSVLHRWLNENVFWNIIAKSSNSPVLNIDVLLFILPVLHVKRTFMYLFYLKMFNRYKSLMIRPLANRYYVAL